MLQLWVMPQLQEDIVDFIFQQDRAPPHYHLDVHAHLNANLPGRWIGHASHNDFRLLLWPPPSPDLTPLRFFLMGLHQGSCVCASYATWFTTAAIKDRGVSHCYKPPNVAPTVASPRVHISSTCKVGQKLGVSLSLLICSFLPCLSWLLRSRVRKSQRDLWIALYIYCIEIHAHCIIRNIYIYIYIHTYIIHSFLCPLMVQWYTIQDEVRNLVTSHETLL